MDETTTAAAAIDMGFVRGVITALTMAVFFGITAWAYHRGNRERFDEDAMLVFADDEPGTETSAARAATEREGEKQ